MKASIRQTLICLFSAIACWCGYIFNIPENMQFTAAFAAVFFSVGFLCFLAVTVAAKISADVSPYRVFAIADGLTGLCAAGYAVYDIVTDTSFFAGIAGIMLLVFIIPVTVFLLLADFFVWRLKKDKKMKGKRK